MMKVLAGRLVTRVQIQVQGLMTRLLRIRPRSTKLPLLGIRPLRNICRWMSVRLQRSIRALSSLRKLQFRG